jgi:hypothetical protein
MKRKRKRILSAATVLILLPAIGASMVYVLNHVDGISPRAETINCEGRIRQVALIIALYREAEGASPVSQEALYRWGGVDPKYVRCMFIESVDESQYVIHCDRLESAEKTVVAHCPTPHRSHGKDLFRFTRHPAGRSVVYTDLSTATVLEVDFETDGGD